MEENNPHEKILVLIKPDGLKKSITGNIITSLSAEGLKIVGAKVVKVTEDFAKKHYSDLEEGLKEKFGDDKGPKVFKNVIDYIQGKFHTDRVLALVYAGPNCVERVRRIAGETDPEEAHPVTIRGKYGRVHSKTSVFENVVHCSDSKESAQKEIDLWFKPEEVVDYEERFEE